MKMKPSEDATTCVNDEVKNEDLSEFNWKNPLKIFITVAIITGIGELFSILLNSQIIFIAYIAFILAYIIIGYSVIVEAYESIKRHDFFNENTLMVIATIGALFTQSFPEAIAVMLFYRVGELVEEYGLIRSKKSIRALVATRPEYAIVKNGDVWEKRKPETVCIGEIVQIKPGERVPVDGTMLSDNSTFDTSALTGESVPRIIHQNEPVLSGMINQSNLIEIEVTKTFENFNNFADSRFSPEFYQK